MRWAAAPSIAARRRSADVGDADLVVLAAPVRQNVALLADAVGARRPAARRSSPTSAAPSATSSTRRERCRARRRSSAAIRSAAPSAAASGSRGRTCSRAGPGSSRPAERRRADGARARCSTSSRGLGARPTTMDAAEHDRLMAFLSHLPQLTASALMEVVGRRRRRDGLRLAGRGLVDTTRLASSPASVVARHLRDQRRRDRRRARRSDRAADRTARRPAARRGDRRGLRRRRALARRADEGPGADLLDAVRRELLEMRAEDLRVRAELERTGRLSRGHDRVMDGGRSPQRRRLRDIIAEHGWPGRAAIGTMAHRPRGSRRSMRSGSRTSAARAAAARAGGAPRRHPDCSRPTCSIASACSRAGRRSTARRWHPTSMDELARLLIAGPAALDGPAPCIGLPAFDTAEWPSSSPRPEDVRPLAEPWMRGRDAPAGGSRSRIWRRMRRGQGDR